MSPVAEIFEERPDDEDEDVSPLYVYCICNILKKKINIFFCIIVYLILQGIKSCNNFFSHNNTCILILLKFRPPQKENTMVEEEAAEMEDKVSEAEEESADQKAKSKPKEV